MSLVTATVALLVLAVVAGALQRLWRGERDARAAVLILGSAASAGLLYLTLYPPTLPVGGETLTVATMGAPARVAGARVVALPEARVPAAERVPDLATALRRYPQVARLVVVGRGLPERDRAAAAGLPLAFSTTPAPAGLVRLAGPPPVAPGGAFAVNGAVAGLPGASVLLRDPSGRRIDQVRVDRDGGFVLAGAARTPGTAAFAIEVRRGERVVETAPVMVTVEADAPLRVLIGGAPSPETKYLRRWASDAGFAVRSRLETGGGIALGEPAALTSAALRAADVAVVDARGWRAGRAALLSAVQGGLGVVIRLNEAPDAALRRDLAGLGFRLGVPTPQPVRLPPAAIDAEALVALRGPDAGDAAALDEPAPELARWAAATGPTGVVTVRDGGDALVAGWSARGLGRVALWTVVDSYALVLAGRGDLYDDWWSNAVSAVARAQARFAPEVPAIVRAGTRAMLCGLRAGASVTAPGGRTAVLQPIAGCAAYWPVELGTHLLRQGAARRPVAVLATDALPAEAAASDATATRTLAAGAGTAPDVSGERRGPAWPWFLAWLAVSALLWLAERRPRWLSRTAPNEAGRRARPADRP